MYTDNSGRPLYGVQYGNGHNILNTDVLTYKQTLGFLENCQMGTDENLDICIRSAFWLMVHPFRLQNPDLILTKIRI